MDKKLFQAKLESMEEDELGDPLFQVKTEAHRCLFCYDPPCNLGCPAQIDVAGFIQRIKHNDFEGGADFIRSRNLFGAICSYVCPTENLCEKDCPRGRIDRPIQIGRLQRFLCKLTEERGSQKRDKLIALRSGRRIAIIGGGPAGLSCAHRLSILGHSVTVFEKREKLGGLLVYGIPEFRLPRSVLQKEMKALLDQMSTVEIRTGIEAGRDISMNSILENHDAVFAAIGLQKGKRLAIPGIDSKGVFQALDLLGEIESGRFEESQLGKSVAVIGGGNVAIDLACILTRSFGRRVIVLYRRTRKEIPAWKVEFEKAVEYGVEFRWETLPVEVVERGGDLSELKCVRTLSHGRQKEVDIEGPVFPLVVDSVVQAIGQEVDLEFLKKLPEVRVEKGRVVINPESGQTTNPKIFAGGDLLPQGGTIVQAVEDGRKSADAIDQWLKQKIMTF